ncbi:MAG TPA: hypothetical protein VFQ54_12965 [Thermomicrobiales bacterium]|nr:hypothetical protein [Thermomicrobiales bacterium]
MLRRLQGGVTVLLVLATVACGSGGGDEPAVTRVPTFAATPSPVATPSTPVKMLDVVWATAAKADRGGPSRNLTSIPENAKTIYAFAMSGAIPAGSVLEAKWTMNGIAIPGISQRVTVTEALPAGWVEFHLSWTGAQNWPQGTLAVTIVANGKVSSSGSIEIVAT